MNYYLVKLTENRQNGHIGAVYCSKKDLEKLEKLSNVGGFLRFNIDIMKETNQKPNEKDKKALNNFLENIKL